MSTVEDLLRDAEDAAGAAQAAADDAADAAYALRKLPKGTTTQPGLFEVLAEAIRDHERERYTDPRALPTDGPDRALYDRLCELERDAEKGAVA